MLVVPVSMNRQTQSVEYVNMVRLWTLIRFGRTAHTKNTIKNDFDSLFRHLRGETGTKTLQSSGRIKIGRRCVGRVGWYRNRSILQDAIIPLNCRWNKATAHRQWTFYWRRPFEKEVLSGQANWWYRKMSYYIHSFN